MTKEQNLLSDEQKWQLLASHEKLGEILLKHGMISLAQLEKVVALQQGTGKPLGELVVSEGMLTRQQVMQALSWQQQSEKVEQQAIQDLKEKKK